MHYNNIQKLCESMVAPDDSELRSTNISFGLVLIEIGIEGHIEWLIEWHISR